MKAAYVALIVVASIVTAVLIGYLSRGPAHINVILISIDTLRPDHLGCYGYDRSTSPRIDRFSEDAVVFENAFASVPLTLPSHSSMLTGLYSISHGVRDNGAFMLAPEFTTLAELLKPEGYETAAFIGAFVLDSRYGLDQGFDRYADEMTGGRQLSAFGYVEKTADQVTSEFVEWLDGAEGPFFAFVHYYGPHMPYEAPEAYKSRHRGRPYDAEIEFADSEVGRLLDEVEARGLLRNTLILMVSDHGEGLGEHGEPTHGYLAYDSTLRVVFIMRLPEASYLSKDGGAGRRVSTNVRLVDLMPTILEIVGLDHKHDIDGRSIVPLLEGHIRPPEISYFETLLPYYAFRWSPLRGVRFNDWKYILAPQEELYNLREDPLEKNNLIYEEAGKAAELRQALEEFARLDNRPKPSSEVQMTSDETGKLSALGYVSRSHGPVPEPGDMKGSDPKDVLQYIVLYLSPGEEAYNHGDLATALAKFKALIEVDPGNPAAYIHLVRVLLDTGDLDEAAQAAHRAIEIDSTNSAAYFHLGNIYQSQGRLDEALGYYETALSIMPGAPEALANIGSILVERGLTDSAIVLLSDALKVDPYNEIALLNLGIAHSMLRMHDEALRTFHRLIKINPGHAKALANCGAIYVAKKDADSALYYFRAASEADPNNAQYLYNLGTAYRQKGMMGEAAECYEELIEREPDNLLALFGLAGVRASQGRREEAVALLRRIVEIDPDFEMAANALRVLSSGE